MQRIDYHRRHVRIGSLPKDSQRDIYLFICVSWAPGYQSITKYHAYINAVFILYVNTTIFDGYTRSFSEILYNRILRKEISQ
jgi:hypothetical protein